MDSRAKLTEQLFSEIQDCITIKEEEYGYFEEHRLARIMQLINQGADLAAIRDNHTPIALAAHHCLWRIVSAIASTHPTTANDSYHYGSALLQAVKGGHNHAAKCLLNAGAPQTWHLNKKQGEEYRYCLHIAVKRNDKLILQLLLQHGGNINQTNGKADGIGLTPVELACKLGHWSCAQLLIQNKHIPFTHRSFLAFRMALKADKKHIADSLIRASGGPTLKTTKDDGNTVLHNIISHWQHLGIHAENALIYALDHGAKQDAQNNENQTAIELASIIACKTQNASNHWHCVQLLIEHNKKKVKPEKCAAFHFEKVLQRAIQDEHYSITQLLLERGTPCNAYDMKFGNIALYLAVTTKNSKILSLLLMHGADTTRLNQFGTSIFDIARETNDASCISALHNHEPAPILNNSTSKLPSITLIGIFSPPITDADSRPSQDSTSLSKSKPLYI